MEEIKSELKINGGYPLHTFQDVKELYFVYITKPEDRQMIEKSYDFAAAKHDGQFRKSGEPYIHHLIEVAYIVTTLQGGPSTIAAAFLHDVVEDTDVTIEQIGELFGEDVQHIVDALTKIQRLKLSHRTSSDFEAEDHRKIFLGMAKDIRVIIIKLADRLHNMRTLDSLTPDRRIALAQETLDVFAPIAHRLGINTIKSELEDLCLKYLEPDKYEEILDLMNKKTKNRQKSLDALKKRIADILFESNVPFEMESRVKSVYSIYKKIYKKGHNFDEIYDILAIRIITKTEINCYEVLGIIHATYKPIPGRFKDYIAVPKPNMYQSLHTSIISGDGNIFEVQIRTKEMDEIAESGIAAHWRYKEGSNYNPKQEQKEIEEKLHWFRDFVTMSNDQDGDAKEYMDTLSKDIFEANVYVFTPKGKVVDLPSGAGPLDFAYKVHTKVGDSAVGAIVNNQLVPLNTILKTGDVVEIKTSKTSLGPNEGWLKIAKTQAALSHIRKAILKKKSEMMRDEIIAKGKESLVDAFKERGVSEEEMMAHLTGNDKLLENFGMASLDDLFYGLANRNPSPGYVIEFLKIKKEVQIKLSKKNKNDNHNPVYVTNSDSVAITLGSCCTPIPGDDIVGYITKGKGVTVHRINCPNIAHQKTRLIDVNWKENLELQSYPVDVCIEANDRNSLLADLMQTLSIQKVNVTSLNAKLHSTTMTTTVNATIYVSDSKRLNDLMDIIRNVKGVYNVSRVIH